MAIRLVVTRGFGNGTFDGDIAHVVTRGYGAGSRVDVRRDRDAWHGKKKPLHKPLDWPHQPATSVPEIEDPENLWDIGWKRATAPVAKAPVPKQITGDELNKYNAAKQRELEEIEDEEVILKVALEYLLN